LWKKIRKNKWSIFLSRLGHSAGRFKRGCRIY
jgi:hypothetical protein